MTMTLKTALLLPLCAVSLLSACSRESTEPEPTTPEAPALPAPDTSHDVANYSTVIGWPEGKTPVAPAGFRVTKYADGLDSPRWLYVLPNGDVLVAEAATENSADRITLLRDSDHDGTPDVRETFLQGLHQPLGMLLLVLTDSLAVLYVGRTVDWGEVWPSLRAR